MLVLHAPFSHSIDYWAPFSGGGSGLAGGPDRWSRMACWWKERRAEGVLVGVWRRHLVNKKETWCGPRGGWRREEWRGRKGGKGLQVRYNEEMKDLRGKEDFSDGLPWKNFMYVNREVTNINLPCPATRSFGGVEGADTPHATTRETHLRWGSFECSKPFLIKTETWNTNCLLATRPS